MKVYLNPRRDNPQGFDNGKLAKQGIFACMWNCGDYFSTQDEAKHHVPCAGREESDRICEEMKELARIERGYDPLQIEQEHEVESKSLVVDPQPQVVQVAVVLDEREHPLPPPIAFEEKQSEFNTLPVQDPQDRVCWFIANTNFDVGFD